MSARICYIDTSLRSDVGHYANACRYITGEFRRRGLMADAYGHRGLAAHLGRELNVTPFFRHASYDNILAHAPVAALHRADYALGRASFLQDLKDLWRRGPYDLIYINSILPAQLAALALWLKRFRTGEAPAVAVEFGAPSGTGMAGEVRKGSLHWRQFTPLWRRAGRLLPGPRESRLLCFAFDPAASADYAALLGRRVETMPAVHQGPATTRLRRRRDGKVTAAFLGHQRDVKGYHLVPEIVRQLAARHVPVRLLVHNGDAADDPVSRELRDMAAANSEVAFEHRPAGGADWQDLLDRSDLVVLPYEPARYRASYSALAVEAVSAGIPMVVPAGTTMESLARTVTFGEWDASSVAGAVERAVAEFDELAPSAVESADRWRQANGAGRFVDRLLEFLPIETRRPGTLPESGSDRLANAVLDAFFATTGVAVRGLRAVLR